MRNNNISREALLAVKYALEYSRKVHYPGLHLDVQVDLLKAINPQNDSPIPQKRTICNIMNYLLPNASKFSCRTKNLINEAYKAFSHSFRERKTQGGDIIKTPSRGVKLRFAGFRNKSQEPLKALFALISRDGKPYKNSWHDPIIVEVQLTKQDKSANPNLVQEFETALNKLRRRCFEEGYLLRQHAKDEKTIMKIRNAERGKKCRKNFEFTFATLKDSEDFIAHSLKCLKPGQICLLATRLDDAARNAGIRLKVLSSSMSNDSLKIILQKNGSAPVELNVCSVHGKIDDEMLTKQIKIALGINS